MLTSKKSLLMIFCILIILPSAVQPAQAAENSKADERAVQIYRRQKDFMISVMSNDTKTFLRLFENDPSTLVRLRLKDGSSPLLIASRKGNGVMVDALLRGGAKVDLSIHKTGLTPLIAASAKGHLSIVQKLLMHRANINAVYHSFQPETPLVAASKGGHVPVVEFLASIPEQQEYELSLTWAIYKGYPMVVRALMSTVVFSRQVARACIENAERMNDSRRHPRAISLQPEDAPCLPTLEM